MLLLDHFISELPHYVSLLSNYFRGRNFREQKLSRDQKIAKFLTKTFANSNFCDEFQVKNFCENQKTLHLQGKKLS